jgi:uncharacterized membrane protein
MTPSNIAVIALVFLIGLIVGVSIFWLIGRDGSRGHQVSLVQPKKAGVDLSFRFSYMVLPVAVAVVTIIGLALLYSSLPGEVFFRFSSSGAPRGSISRELFMVLMIGAQLVLVAAAAVISFVVLRMAKRMLKEYEPAIDPGRIIWLMANMVVLPQLIVSFVALDAAYYANSGSHIVTPWLFSLATVGLGTLVIIFLFVLSFNSARGSK